MHALDRPVWETLTSHHAALSEGGALARRFVRDVNLFAAARDDAPESLAALADLIAPGETIFILQRPEIVIPPGFEALKQAHGVQMAAGRAVTVAAADIQIDDLGDADAPEMLALATLTEPGPFLARTHAMGQFRGVRLDTRLAAMAGERMRLPGYTEVSGVCTHPDFRGRGLARRLSETVAAAIQARGDTPFLHAWTTNTAAIALYEALGFVHRCIVNVAVLRRVGD
ncbi:MAG: GNAT family N-acetyltransferase [Alphaproteobacteria bacterium]|nr:GNAT family N-acetyltransferase [Alphaproteobacteria bacterium]